MHEVVNGVSALLVNIQTNATCAAISKHGSCPRCKNCLPIGKAQCLAGKDATAAKRLAHEPASRARRGRSDGRTRPQPVKDAEVGVVHVIHNQQDGQRPRATLCET